MKRRLSLLPNLYQVVVYYVLWVTSDIIRSDLWEVSGNEAAKCLKVLPCLRPVRRDYPQADVEVLQHTQPFFGTFFVNFRG